MSKPLAEIWYGVEAMAHGVLRLRELAIEPFLSGDLWLIQGAERNLLVDTGTGMVSPRPLVEAISGKPLMVVALNGFYDHAGGLHFFDERACHTLEAEAISRPTAKSSLVPDFVSDAMLSALPRPGFSTSDYRMIGAPPTRLLEDGDAIDLGDRILEVLHVPGVSPGHLALWEAATGALFTGDTLFNDPLARPTTLRSGAVYWESLKRLRALPVETVYGGHYGTFDRAVMLEIIDRQFADR
ncbi:MAG: MBL fold metallo-hydrolase [Pseudomonadota bacterium]